MLRRRQQSAAPTSGLELLCPLLLSLAPLSLPASLIPRSPASLLLPLQPLLSGPQPASLLLRRQRNATRVAAGRVAYACGPPLASHSLVSSHPPFSLSLSLSLFDGRRMNERIR